ncbi:ARPP-2 domain-containing protein [Saccharothrix obliqua]|uniref:ARPP-2 domain-containing protein n=1 Tax=Saccharothrix obliqua TaxID=2861747 RepID=UPI001C5FB8AD|nr:hypothetical protein [Saccharothrix obliqua]MBW4717998.1 hypothetical protein [Saccharothrix obliqua]
MARLDLTGLTTRPAQVWGGVRLVPLVRDEPITQLRLHPRLHDGVGVVDVGDGTHYVSYIPHGFVAAWTTDGTPAAAYGTELTREDAPRSTVPVRFHRRMARRVDKNRLRFLPLHLALEGYLALHFGGPDVVWDEWSQRAIRHGLSPRAEQAYLGERVDGLADAVKVFEIHPGQCGVAVYAADALAAVFVVPHPDDYRELHATLVHDMYGELVYQYALYSAPVRQFEVRLPDAHIRTLADLRAAANRQQAEWSAFHGTMAAGLLEPSYDIRRVHRMGGFTLSRFLPGFRVKEENHIGELITDSRGRTAYLKTFRLSESQIRRGYLLNHLSAHGWRMSDAAAALGVTEARLGTRIASAGLGSLLREDVLARYRSAISR